MRSRSGGQSGAADRGDGARRYGGGARRPAGRAPTLRNRAARSSRTGRPEVPAAVSPALSLAAAYGWRLIVVGAVVYGIFVALGRFHLVTVAVFLALVLTALLGPVADLLNRRMPRYAAVALALLLGLLLLFGVLSLIGANVAGEWQGLRREFDGGVARIEDWLEGPPVHMRPDALSDVQARVSRFVSSHRSTLISTALTGADRVVKALTVAALALFCSVFFLHSGDRMWRWFDGQLPLRTRPPARLAGRAAWRTFTGYTRGIVLIAAINAVLVGAALFALGLPLALPLAVLEFFAAFVPLIGSPVALAVAAVVALATEGPLVAGVVALLIVVIGQIEGHVLHPFVMSWAVRLHPVVVALTVICGSVTAGVLGAVVAVPLVSVVWSVFTALRTPPVPLSPPPAR